MNIVMVDNEYYGFLRLKMKLNGLPARFIGMFENIGDFLHELHHLKPDVVFLDFEMASHNGYEVLKRMLEQKSVPDIVLMISPDDQSIPVIDINVITLVRKPLAKHQLHKIINQFHMRKQESNSDGMKQADRFVQITKDGDLQLYQQNENFLISLQFEKAKELLLQLAALSGQFVYLETIAERVWPKDHSDKRMLQLLSVVYYLKQIEKEYHIRLPFDFQRGTIRHINTTMILQS